MINIGERISVVGLFFIVALVLVQIFMRYVLEYPLSWTDELARILHVWIVFIGAYIALFKNEHVRVEYFMNSLPPTWQPRLELFVSLLCSIFSCTLAISAATAIGKLAKAKTAALGLPMPVVFAATFICSILMMFYLVVSIIKTLRDIFSEK